MADEASTSETDAPETQTDETQPTTEQQSGDLPEAVKEILSKERKAARDAEKARKAAEARIKEYEDRDKSNEQKLTDDLQAAQAAREEATAKLARFEVAAEKQLPGDLVGLLEGSREEMAAKADLLLTHIKDAQRPPEFGGGPRDQAPPESPEQSHNKLILGLLGRNN